MLVNYRDELIQRKSFIHLWQYRFLTAMRPATANDDHSNPWLNFPFLFFQLRSAATLNNYGCMICGRNDCCKPVLMHNALAQNSCRTEIYGQGHLCSWWCERRLWGTNFRYDQFDLEQIPRIFHPNILQKLFWEIHVGNVQMGHMKYHEIGRWNLMSSSVVETPLSFFVAASLLRCSPSGPEARRTKKPSDWLIGSSEFQFPSAWKILCANTCNRLRLQTLSQFLLTDMSFYLSSRICGRKRERACLSFCSHSQNKSEDSRSHNLDQN